MKMKILKHSCFAGISILAFTLSGCGGGDKSSAIDALKRSAKNIELEEDQIHVTEAILTFAKAESLAPYFGNSYGCVIFPTIGKGGLGIGGAHGKGWVFSQGQLTGETTMNQLTVGFQAGGQAFSQIIFLEDQAAYNNFTSGNFEFGAQASAVAITIGANAQASTAGGTSAGAASEQTKNDYTGGMAVFTIAKGGLMYEASIGGQKFKFKAYE